jgi:ankyrin repeat protein
MESSEKNIKEENGMSITFPKFSDTEISKSNNNSNNTTSFGLSKFDLFDTNASIISEFMSLSLTSKIEKFKSNPSLRKLKDKNSSNTFLHFICMNDDNFPLLEIIKPTNKEINRQNNFGETSLHIGIINKCKKITKYLIENGADVNASDYNLNMSLHLAVMNNDIDLIKLLIEYKANPLLVNKNNETVLDIAIKMNFEDCINLLKEVSLMNETKKNKNKKIFELKTEINENKPNINEKENTIDNPIKNINNKNIIFSHKIIHHKKIMNPIFFTPKKNLNIITYTKNSSCSSYKRKNVFFTSKKPKTRQRINSTTTISYPLNEQNIYSKKIINRSQSTSNANNIENTLQNHIPRKTDFITKNEQFLESDNESIEEEESVIRDNTNINNKDIKDNKQNIEKILENFTSMKTVKITPLTETNNKKNPFQQVDSFVTAIHKNDQGISESNGYIKEDDLVIIEPSIDITNKNDIENKETKDEKKMNKEIKDTKEELYNFLLKIEMEQYTDILIQEGFDDIDLVINQMKTGNPINDDILREIGIERPGDRAKILIRIQECAGLFEFKIQFEPVYYINRKKFEFLRYDFHVKSLQNWPKKLKLQNYLGNFYNNGYYSPELIFVQKASKFPIDDTILERDLKIENINDRKLIMSSISSDSDEYISNLKSKKEKIQNGIYIENKQIEENEKCIIY